MAPSPRIPGPLLLPPLSSLTLSSLRRVSWSHVHTFAAEPGERLGGGFKACNRPSQPAIWFQLGKIRLTRVPSRHRATSGRTRDTSSSRNALDFINTAKCPPPSIGTNAFAGARMESTNERARLVGVVKSSAP